MGEERDDVARPVARPDLYRPPVERRGVKARRRKADGGIARRLLERRERLADHGHRSRLGAVRVSDLFAAAEGQGGH